MKTVFAGINIEAKIKHSKETIDFIKDEKKHSPEYASYIDNLVDQFVVTVMDTPGGQHLDIEPIDIAITDVEYDDGGDEVTVYFEFEESKYSLKNNDYGSDERASFPSTDYDDLPPLFIYK